MGYALWNLGDSLERQPYTLRLTCYSFRQLKMYDRHNRGYNIGGRIDAAGHASKGGPIVQMKRRFVD